MNDPVAFLDLGASHAAIRPRLDAVWEATVDRNGFIGGDEVSQFEAEFASYTGTRFCVGVSNGTDALELILAGLGIGAGDEVIVPANTFIATAEAVLRAGATPIFVDVDPATALITGDHARAALTPRTAAVMAVHLYGQTVNMTDLLAVTDPAGVAVIEDAAQAHGASWEGKPAGSMGVAAGFSFYPGKNLGAFGDGGAVTTADQGLAETDPFDGQSRPLQHLSLRTRRARPECKTRRTPGCGPSHQAWRAGLLEQSTAGGGRPLRRQDLRAVPSRLSRPTEPARSTPVRRALCVADKRDLVTESLDCNGVGWGIHYPIPCHLQTPLRTDTTARIPVVEEHAGQLLSLPMHPHLTIDEIDRVVGALDELDAH